MTPCQYGGQTGICARIAKWRYLGPEREGFTRFSLDLCDEHKARAQNNFGELERVGKISFERLDGPTSEGSDERGDSLIASLGGRTPDELAAGDGHRPSDGPAAADGAPVGQSAQERKGGQGARGSPPRVKAVGVTRMHSDRRDPNGDQV